MATFDDLLAVAGKQLFDVLSTRKDMGGRDFLRKGLGGRQASQTRAAIEAVRKGKSPAVVDQPEFNGLKAVERKAVAVIILCGRVPAVQSDGIGISGPTVDAERLPTAKRERLQAVRAELASFYGLEELRKLYPRSSTGVTVRSGDAEDAPMTDALNDHSEMETL